MVSNIDSRLASVLIKKLVVISMCSDLKSTPTLNPFAAVAMWSNVSRDLHSRKQESIIQLFTIATNAITLNFKMIHIYSQNKNSITEVLEIF